MELWDIYTRSGEKTGRTHSRSEPLSPGDYHLAVSTVIVGSQGVLCTLRSTEKSVFPGVWESPGGGVLAGETSLEGAVRELWEETGIRAKPNELCFLCRRTANNLHMDVYGLKREIPPENLTLQPGEVDKAAWIPLDQWEQKARSREILAGAYSDEFFAAVWALNRQDTVTVLEEIFERHRSQRICVLGTICCGKTTLLRQISGSVDLDDELWPQLTKNEAAFISQKPWSPEIGKYIDQLVYAKITVKPGHPLFTTIIVDCDVVIYLDLSDELLAKRCKQRGVSFSDAKNVKNAVEDDWRNQQIKGGKPFYVLILTE